jgi:hypothetical protein
VDRRLGRRRAGALDAPGGAALLAPPSVRARRAGRGAALAALAFWLAPASALAEREPGYAEPNPPVFEGGPAATAEQRLRRAPSTEWVLHKSADALHPDGNEQQMLWLANRARQDPAAEGVWLATSGEGDVAFGRNFFAVDTDLLQQELAELFAEPPAAFDRRLWDASRLHALDLIARNAQDHTGQAAKVQASGFVGNGGSLSVFSYADSALNAHAALTIDWGPGDGTGMQPGRGHRDAVMGCDGDPIPPLDVPYDNVGLALVPDPLPGVGPLVFAGAYYFADTGEPDHYRRFLVGTVWQDVDGNARYDPGEGLAGVTVMPDVGAFYAITAAGGGYAIPITAAGSYQVTFSGGGIGAPRQLAVVVGADSQLLDLEIPVPEPAQALLLVAGTLLLLAVKKGVWHRS